MTMAIAEHLRTESFTESFHRGYQEGYELGLMQGKRWVIGKVLEKKFGPLNETRAARVAELDHAAIDRAVDRIFTADSIDAVLL